MSKAKPQGKKPGKPQPIKVLVKNRRASHDYELSDRHEAGLVLLGSEVKALRESAATINDAYVEIKNGEAWLVNVQIQPYAFATAFAHEPGRRRKLLLHKREINKLDTKFSQKGYTIVPLALVLKNGKVKLELAVGRGKREYDKRHAKRDAESKRETDREMKR